MARISLDEEKIADFCRIHHIRRLSLFGSVLRDDFGPASDVDVLVEFEPGHVPGLAFFAMEEELSQIIGRKVDLNTPGFLSPYFRDRIERESEVQYVTDDSELSLHQMLVMADAHQVQKAASRLRIHQEFKVVSVPLHSGHRNEDSQYCNSEMPLSLQHGLALVDQLTKSCTCQFSSRSTRTADT